MIKAEKAKQPVQGSKVLCRLTEEVKKKKQGKNDQLEPEFPLQGLNPEMKKGVILEIRLVSLQMHFNFHTKCNISTEK